MIKLLTPFILLSLAACGGGSSGGGGGGGGAPSQQALIEEIERIFPYSPSSAIDVLYLCARVNSALTYYFHLKPDTTFDVYSTTDTGDDFMFSGTYTTVNDQLRLQSASNILPLDETTTATLTALGLLYGFETPGMVCGAYGHGYNTIANYGHYRCPDINQGAVSSVSNAVEINHFSMPFNLQVVGSMFRQRDTYVSGMVNPLVLRGNGIYRRDGDRWYGYFHNQFDDFPYLSGTFGTGDGSVDVEQFGVACNL
jgi:hypothetical protein